MNIELLKMIILMNWEQARCLVNIDEGKFWKAQSMIPSGLVTPAYKHFRVPLYGTSGKGFDGLLHRFRRGMVTYPLPGSVLNDFDLFEDWINMDDAKMPYQMLMTEPWTVTDNLWGQGTIPEEYRDFFEPNAEIESV